MKTRNFFTLIIIALMVIALIWTIAEKIVASPFTIFLWIIIVTMGIRECFNEE